MRLKQAYGKLGNLQIWLYNSKYYIHLLGTRLSSISGTSTLPKQGPNFKQNKGPVIWVPELKKTVFAPLHWCEYLANFIGHKTPILKQSSRKQEINHISRKPSWWVGQYRPIPGPKKNGKEKTQQRGMASSSCDTFDVIFATFPQTFQNNLVCLIAIALPLPNGPLAHTEDGLKFYILSRRTKPNKG